MNRFTLDLEGRQRLVWKACWTLAATLFAVSVLVHPATSDAQSSSSLTLVVDQVWHDDQRHRDIPVRLRIPVARAGSDRLPIIIYSHGLGGSRESGEAWGEYWASHGYFVIHVQHAGSDDSVWRPMADRLKTLGERIEEIGVGRALAAAATPAQLAERTLDIRFILDELPGRAELQQADLSRIGMSGHSFGALTTQVLAGQQIGRRAPVVGDPRIRAAIAFSPMVRNRVDAEMQFNNVSIPFMSITGTLDTESIGANVPAEERVRPYYAMPPGGKFLVVFKNADHTCFTGRNAFQDRNRSSAAVAAEPQVVRSSQVLTLAFWDAYLKGNPMAERWLVQQHRRVLSQDDRFEAR
jgi:predicted dienelactone hydrolase